MTVSTKQIGYLAKTICNKELDYPAQAKADAALENGSWTQKESP